MRLLQWCHFRCTNKAFILKWCWYLPQFAIPLEMRHRFGKDMAHGALFLCPVRPAVWRGWLPWARRQAVLSQRLLRYVCTEVQRMQSRNHGELYFSAELSVASGLLCLPGNYIIFLLLPCSYFQTHNMSVSSNFVIMYNFDDRRTAKRQFAVSRSMRWKVNQFAQHVLVWTKRNRSSLRHNQYTSSKPTHSHSPSTRKRWTPVRRSTCNDRCAVNRQYDPPHPYFCLSPSVPPFTAMYPQQKSPWRGAECHHNQYVLRVVRSGTTKEKTHAHYTQNTQKTPLQQQQQKHTVKIGDEIFLDDFLKEGTI